MTTNTNFANLFENTIAVSVSFDGMSIRRTVSMDGVEVDADKDRCELKSRILQCPEMRKIRNLRSNLRSLISDMRRGLTLPAKVFRDGVFLIPISMFEEVDSMLKTHQATLEVLVEELAEVYEQRIEEDKTKLRSKFNAKHYPAKSALAAVWGISWRYFSLAPSPVLAKVSPDAFNAELANANAQVVEMGQEIIASLRGAAYELVAKMRDALGFGEDGKPRVFRDSQVENFANFLNLFTKKNVLQDTELASKLAEMKALLTATAEEIRDDETLRAKLREQVTVIASDLEGMVEEVKTRSIRLPEEPDAAPEPVAEVVEIAPVESCKKHKGEPKPCARCSAEAKARRANKVAA
jgi:hypothetical protein